MRIAISAESNNGLDSIIGHHFGRCPYFALVDIEGNEIKGINVIDNPFFAGHEVGQVPGFIHEQGADVMLSGGMGGRAIQFFTQFGIDIATGASGTVKQAVTEFLAGNLSGTAPCAESIEHGHGHDH